MGDQVRAGGERSGLTLEHGSNHARWCVPRKRLLAAEHFVQHAAEGKDVRTGVSRGPLQLLGRHVVQRAEEGPSAGQRSLRCELREPQAGDLDPWLSQTKIQQLRP
jgi:hypothetical protein